MSRPEVFAHIRELKPDLSAIFVTGYSPDTELIQKVREEGWPVLQKPYASRLLARTVRETLDQRTSVLPPIANHD
jgi:DNA-binding NtrC family response regulator